MNKDLNLKSELHQFIDPSLESSLSTENLNGELLKKENAEIEADTENNSSAQSLKCDYCDRSFLTYRSLQCHFKIHNEKVLECCYCDLRFNRTDGLISHVVDHLMITGHPLLCPSIDCDVTVPTMLDGEQHVFQDHFLNGASVFKCKDCDEKSQNFRKLFIHRLVKHGELKEFAEKSMNRQKKYLQTKKNQSRRSKKRGIAADYIEMKKRSLIEKSEPLEINPDVENSSIEEPKKLAESEMKSLELVNSLKQAVTSNSGESASKMLEKMSEFIKKMFPICEKNEMYRCAHCAIRFEDAILWMVHLGFHDVEDPFKCTGCGKKFENRQAFVIHLTYFAHGSKSEKDAEI